MLTHKELTGSGRRPAGTSSSDCAGEVVVVGRFDDQVIAPGAGVVRSREIVLYRCLKCESRISTADGQILNDHNHGYAGPPRGSVTSTSTKGVPL